MRAERKTRKRKYCVMRWRKNDPTHNLYKAVRDYVRSHSGSIVIIGGVSVQQFPAEPEFKYHIAVGCVGKKPEFKKESRP